MQLTYHRVIQARICRLHS